jgi:hypothetical protein
VSWKATAAVKPLTHDNQGQILTAREKLVLFVLADYHNDDRGAAWAGLTAIAKASLTSRKHTITLLAQLVKRELIAIEQRPQNTNLYRLLFVGDPKSQAKVEGKSIPKAKRGSHLASPGVVTSGGDQGSHLATSPEPSFSRQDSRAAPDRRSQDTRSAPVPRVEKTERQFTDEFKKLAKGKSLPRNGWPTEPVRADLFGGLHSGKQSSGMQAIAKFFFDSRSLSFRDRLLGCVRVATSVLMSMRIAKLIDLRAEDMERLAVEKLEATPEGLRAMEAMADPARQSVVVTQFIARLVVDATAEIYEAQNADAYPPKSSAERALQVAM